MELKPE